MTLASRYQARLDAEGLVADSDQLRIVDAFQSLTDALSQPPERGLRRWFSTPPTVTGLYVWGGVGRGKTWLMDLFHDSLDDVAKTRLHFHRFMYQVHDALKGYSGRSNPLQAVASDMAKQARVLCLDEFHVVDIGDAMILSGLLRGLVDNGVTLVTTSNVPPEELYRDGIQRASFLPAIDLLNQSTRVVHLGGERDYRRLVMEQARVYHMPLGDTADARLTDEFQRLANTRLDGSGVFQVNGRDMPYRYRADDMIWFDFEALRGPPRSRNDYIELARCHQTVFLSDIPIMGSRHDDRARRFIFVVDEFYDRRVKLVCSAAASPERLYIGERLAFEFHRTASRLTEMQAPAYLGRAHRG